MHRKGLFPGSFDPFTKGHETVIRKALNLFDEIVIGIGINSSKTSYFELNKRIRHIEGLYQNEPRVKILTYEKLTVEFAKDVDAKYIIRGLRDSKDFDYEKPIAHMNFEISDGIETVFFLTEQRFAAINSNIVREIHRNKADIQNFVSLSHLLD
ncbi:MAG: pantetheine-phosphate adenylyltransferase [Crocinitomicaceae bacterium]|jgi:pantetheine-phosphate adenylyltransferase|nr:pantetheine-phosphate adenylyltransferase [Crocinitomicaceae bacterium]